MLKCRYYTRFVDAMTNFYYIQHPPKISYQVEGPVLREVRLCHSVTFFMSLRHDDNPSCISVFLHCNLKPLHWLKATRFSNISNIFPDFCYAYESWIWTAVHVLRKPCPFYVTPSWRYFLIPTNLLFVIWTNSHTSSVVYTCNPIVTGKLFCKIHYHIPKN